MRRTTAVSRNASLKRQCALFPHRLGTTAFAFLCWGALCGSSSALAQEEAKAAPEATPPKASPPGDSKALEGLPEVFKINKPPLITPEELKEFNTPRQNEYRNNNRNGKIDRDLIRQAVRARVFSLTMLKAETDAEKAEGHKIVETFRREIYECGNTATAADKKAIREVLLKEVVDRCKDILDNHLHFYPRMQAVILLGNLNLLEGEGAIRDEAYLPAIEPLLQALDEPGQIDPIKLRAVVGLIRINLHVPNPPSPQLRIHMGESMIRELGNAGAHEWYQARLLEGLGSIDQVNDLQGKPFIITAIQGVLRDKGRPWIARAAAAKALGRAQLTPEMDVDLFAVDIVNLALEMTAAFNGQNGKKSYFWSRCFWDLYCAFKPDMEESKAGRNVGLLNKITRPGMGKFNKVKEAYDQCRPLVEHALASKEANFPKELLTPVQNWLQSNAPADYFKQVPTKQASDGTRPKAAESREN